MVDGLRDTVDKQRKDLDGVRKEIMEKEMLCSALRVGRLFFTAQNLYTDLFIALGVMFWPFFFIYFKYRNRCRTWRLSRTMPKLPEKRREDSGPR